MKPNKKVLNLTLPCIFSIFCFSLSAQQTITIKGSVSDADEVVLPGASVVIKGTSKGTQTDFDGNYSIDANSNDTLVFSYVGFQPQEIQVGNQTVIDVTLISGNTLDEVVVIGYGTQQKSSVTSSVVSVDVSEAQKLVTHDPAISLQGRAPGVQVLTEGGVAGAEARVIIRGAGTFGNTDPLYIIDGAFSTAGMRALNPADIESIEVLKDASASAIYGSRAANGVVLITTRKGRKGAPKIEFSSSLSIQSPARTLEYLNAEEWRGFSNQVAENDDIPRVPEDDNPNFSRGVDTDWQDLWFRSAPIYNNNFNISGGSEYSTFNASLGHLRQEGILEFSQFEKYNARLNYSFKKGKVELNQNVGIAYYENDPNTDFGISGAFVSLTGRASNRQGYQLPTVPLRDSNGNFVAPGEDFFQDGDDFENLYANANFDERRISNVDLTGNVDFSYEILKGLKYKIGFSGSYNSEHDFDRNIAFDLPILGGLDEEVVNLPSLQESRAIQFDYTIDNLLTYKGQFGKHSIDALIGYSRFRENFRRTGSLVLLENDFEQQLTTFNGDATLNGIEFKSLLESWFGRLNYNFDSKYLLSVSLRSDKSSKFADGNNVGTFPSISAGWNIHKEGFFHEDGFVNRLKLRAGYGELGANFIQPYQFSSLAFGPIPTIFGDNQNGGPDLRSFGRVTQLLDPNLQWETAKSTNVGVELGFLNNDLSLTLEYFRRVNEDVLAPVSLPPSAGQTIFVNTGVPPDINSSEIENKGFEMLLDYRNNKNDFKYNISLNVSTIKNEVLALGENVSPILGSQISGSFDDRPSTTDVGGPVGAFWGYRTTGLDENGNFIFQDTNGRDEFGELTGRPDGQIDFDDRVQIGNPFPDFTYGINFFGQYKNFDLSLFLQGSQGNDIFSQIKYQNYFIITSNVISDALNSWTPANTNTNIPIATIENRTGGNALPSDFYVEDGSYLRMKNIQLGYNLPTENLSAFGVKSARIFIGAQNLFTITGYSGFDPEVSPATTFDRGVDFQGFPNTRTLTLGFNLIF